MKILFIVGVYPPKVCGIGDYTKKIEAYLNNETNMKAEVISDFKWTTNPIKLFLKIKKINPNVIHIQYPLTGLSAHLIVIFLSLFYKIIITNHEYLESHWTRKLSMCVFPLAKKLIWTSEIELNEFRKHNFIIKSDNEILNIGSNIPFFKNEEYFLRENSIAFFGSIRPGKGLDQYFKLIELFSENGIKSYKFIIIGTVAEIYKNYYTEITDKFKNHNIIWELNLDDISVAKKLSEIKYVYLPFEDGASERRGSLLASIGNGACVLSKSSKYTTDILKNLIIDCPSPIDAYKFILKNDENPMLISKEKLNIFNDTFSWSNILSCHNKIYTQMRRVVR